MKRKYKLKKSVKEVILGAIAVYALIVIGVIAINYRLANLEQQKSATESEVHIAQNVNR